MSYITYKKPTPEQFKAFSSETEKYRYETAKYCTGVGVDIASQGVAVVPWAISYDLPQKEFLHYSNGNPPKGPLHLRGFADKLPFEDQSLDFLYSSHYIEDVFDWIPLLKEWDRVVKIGGHMIILLPDKQLWADALARGQPCNCEHRHESYPGELTSVFSRYFGHYQVLEDRLTKTIPEDYNILFVAKRIR